MKTPIASERSVEGSDSVLAFTDKVERERAEEAQARLAAIVNSSHDAIISKTLNGIITSWNPGSEKVFGYPAAEAIGKPMLMLFPPERAEEEKEILTRIARGERVEHFETERIRKDGKRIHISVTIAPIIDGSGRIIGASTIARDITERKQMADKLAASEGRYRRLFETAKDGILILDAASGRVVDVNPFLSELLGYSHTFFLGKQLWEIGLFKDIVASKEAFLELQATDYIRYEDLPLETADGRKIAVEFISSVYRVDGAKVIQCSIRDITERRNAEAEAKANAERFRAMANSMSQLAWIAKPDVFIFWYNDRWYDYTGTTPEQMEGWGWQSVHDPEVLPQVMAQWTVAIATGEVFEMEFPLRGADGKFRRFLTRAVPLKDAEGKVLQWFGTNTDVEELKGAQDEIRRLNLELEQRVVERTAQLKAANKELEAFSYSVSHDLRAPLRGLDGFSRMVLEDYGPKLDDEGRRLLNVVCGEAKRMGQLIDDLLAFARLGRQEMKTTEFDMTVLVQDVFASLDPVERKRVLHFEVKPLPLALGDRSMIQQVLVNLIANAVKFSGNKPAPSLEIGGSTADGFNMYYVKDNGAGFDQRFAPKLFGVFQRLHSEAEFPGTGVGLALVQRIIHRHGGKVWAEGKPNAGATFHFTLPTRIKPSYGKPK